MPFSPKRKPPIKATGKSEYPGVITCEVPPPTRDVSQTRPGPGPCFFHPGIESTMGQ